MQNNPRQRAKENVSGPSEVWQPHTPCGVLHTPSAPFPFTLCPGSHGRDRGDRLGI